MSILDDRVIPHLVAINVVIPGYNKKMDWRNAELLQNRLNKLFMRDIKIIIFATGINQVPRNKR